MPAVPRQYVERRRLTARLDVGAGVPLTLVSAPAGSGKTVLVAEWVAQGGGGRTVGWITCEPGDDRPARFWPLVRDCLVRLGVTLPERLTSRAHVPHRLMLTELSAALAGLPSPLHLVLDGLEITDLQLAADLEFVLAHSGRRLRLVVLTRVDPVLPLHRFRLDDTMVELRMSDLAFSVAEASRLLDCADVSMGDEAVAALVARTRGWAVGLRFATMMLEQSEDQDAAVRQLGGDRGHIAEYLLAEILRTQTPEVRTLLLRTSVVDLLQPGLIEELGGRSAPRALDALTHANVLVEEVPGRPGCYRYHPLLRDLLRAELGCASPGLLTRLQRRAASWFADRGLVDEAVSLAAASMAWSDAARYAVHGLAVGTLAVGDEAGGMVTALRETPASARGTSVAVVRAALALSADDEVLCAHELSRARHCVDAAGDPPDPAVDLSIEVVESLRSSGVDDAGAVTAATVAADRIAAWRGEPSAELAGLSALVQTSKGVAQLHQGNFTAARETLDAAARAAEGSGCRPLPVDASAHLALLASLEGRFGHAVEYASRAAELADQTQARREHRPPAAEIALAWVSTERYELETGHEHLALASGSRRSDPVARALAAAVRTRLHRSEGDLEAAAALLDDAGDGLSDRAGWLTDLIALEAAQTSIARGDTDQALRTLDGLREPDRPAAGVVLAHAQLRRGEWAAVGRTLTDVVATIGETPGPAAVEAGILEAALHQHLGRRQPARAALARSLHLAAPERVRRPFREAPEVVRELLETDHELAAQHPWLGMRRRSRLPRRVAQGQPAEDRPESLRKGEIIEPLTAKETEVLGHLSDLLTTEEIAATMFVSVNTVRTHVRNILRKLAVSRRNEAVRRGRALSLLGT